MKDFQRWDAGNRMLFDRPWYVKRRCVLDSIKKVVGRERGSRKLSDQASSWNVALNSLLNPCKVVISSKTKETFNKGLKFCLNMKPSRFDVFS